MTGWREIKRAARRDVHAVLEVPALYLVRRGVTPIPVMVRLHTNFGVANVSGADFGFAQMLDSTPRIIFRRDQVELPARQGIVSVASGEAYTIGATRAPDDEFITAEVAPLTGAETTGLPVPQ